MRDIILVAEDEEDAREAFVELLQILKEDIKILQAGSREEALAIIDATENLALVFTDLRMPRTGDGEAVAKAAQAKDIKVVVISGTPEDLSSEVGEKCLDVITKPVSSEQIAAPLNKIWTN